MSSVKKEELLDKHPPTAYDDANFDCAFSMTK